MNVRVRMQGMKDKVVAKGIKEDFHEKELVKGLIFRKFPPFSTGDLL